MNSRSMAAAGLFALAAALSPPELPAREAGPRPFTWTRLSTIGESGLTFESACAYDRSAGKLVMFGGHDHSYQGVERNDTWLFDPVHEIWSEAYPSNRPIGACNTRDLVFDPVLGGSVYFGGCMYFHGWQLMAEKIRGGAPPWVYDAGRETWIPMKPTGETPPRVAYAGMVYDSHNQVIVKFGGGGCRAADDGGTWVYDGYDNTWTRMSPERSPGSGRLPAMVYDARNRRVLLTGADDGRSNQLWSYDIQDDEWTPLDPSRRPPAGEMVDLNWGGPVDYGRFIYDEENQVPLLFRPYRGFMGTWAYNSGENAWVQISTYRAPPGAALLQGDYVSGGRRSIFVNGATPGGRDYLAGTWSFAHPARPGSDLPDPPAGLGIRSGENTVRLSWERSGGAAKITYAVYRGSGDNPWTVRYERIGETSRTTFKDKAPAGAVQHYYVTAMDDSGRESGPSWKVRTRPRAPAEPRAWAAEGGGVEIRWDASAGPDIAGYNVYRGRGRPGYVDTLLHDGEAGGFEKVNAGPVTGGSYRDEPPSIDEAAYLVRAVNERGEESGPSPWTLAIPSEVQGVEARPVEDGVEIVWRPGREDRLSGYNIYRMSSQHDDKGTRLNEAPVAEARFLDRSAKEGGPARYYVAAVDGRGVEGLMSYGAWLNDDKGF